MARTGILNITEASAIGMHALAAVAAAGRPVSAKEVSGMLKVSHAHLSKVMRQLVRADLLNSATGPGGGFTTTRSPNTITMLEVLEAVDGKFRPSCCLLGKTACAVVCPLGGFLGEMNNKVREMFVEVTVEKLAAALSEAGKKACIEKAGK